MNDTDQETLHLGSSSQHIYSYTIVDKPESWGDAEAKNAFYERLMLEMDRNNHIKISSIDLIFSQYAPQTITT